MPNVPAAATVLPCRAPLAACPAPLPPPRRGRRAPPWRPAAAVAAALAVFAVFAAPSCRAADWPRFRGPEGRGVAVDATLPLRWSAERGVRWKTPIPGEGFSSPIVVRGRVIVTSAFDHGARRAVWCLDRRDGRVVWSREVTDDDPEPTSSMTGHAASTAASDGRRVVAFFGRAGAVCYDLDGARLWRRDLGRFESELGLASSPIIAGERVFIVCDHDGTRFTSFDSFVVALDLATGEPVWRTERRGLGRSWSTPIIAAPAASGGGAPDAAPGGQLIVSAQDALRAYDVATGKPLWRADGLGGWVAPSPVLADGLVIAASGRAGPLLAVRPGPAAEGGETASVAAIVWRNETAGPYVPSPVFAAGLVWVQSDDGVLSCFDAKSGAPRGRRRIGGKFTASPIAGAGRIYTTSEDGVTTVLRAGPEIEALATNELGEDCLASPAASDGDLILRGERNLYSIRGFEAE